MEAYPLTWPAGWKRTPASLRKRAQFAKAGRFEGAEGTKRWIPSRELSIAEGTQRVLRELRTFGVIDGDSIISTNLKTRLDGLPYSAQRAPDDPGVAVYWRRPDDKGMKVMAVDRYDRIADNLAAIAATLEAMRAIERHGGAQILDRAFTGFAALPAPGQTTTAGVRHWREVLGIPEGEQRMTAAEEAYRRLRSKYHPDKPDGDPGLFIAVQDAYAQASIELGNPA